MLKNIVNQKPLNIHKFVKENESRIIYHSQTNNLQTKNLLLC